MDAMNNANYTNSAASGEFITCPVCGSANKKGSFFCMSCGTRLVAERPENTQAPAFSPVFESIEEKPENNIAEPETPVVSQETLFSPQDTVFSPYETPFSPQESVFSSEVPCPACGIPNDSDSVDCIVCGASLSAPSNQASDPAPVFSPMNEPEKLAPEEPEGVFAQGLPSWSIEPPQVPVRRH